MGKTGRDDYGRMFEYLARAAAEAKGEEGRRAIDAGIERFEREKSAAEAKGAYGQYDEAHIFNSICEALAEHLGADAKPVIQSAVAAFIDELGEDAYDSLMDVPPDAF